MDIFPPILMLGISIYIVGDVKMIIPYMFPRISPECPILTSSGMFFKINSIQQGCLLNPSVIRLKHIDSLYRLGFCPSINWRFGFRNHPQYPWGRPPVEPTKKSRKRAARPSLRGWSPICCRLLEGCRRVFSSQYYTPQKPWLSSGSARFAGPYGRDSI